jgi:RNA polymerase sigma factor for flagellar operon FliA
MTDSPDAESKILEFWKKYKKNGDKHARETLILHYAPIVKYVAARVGAGLPKTVDRADLVSYGMFGLIDAIEKFDPSRNIKFETYAMSRIRGAIIDELRSVDWVPRSVRSRIKEIDEIYSTLELKLGRTPNDKEVAEALSISEKELANLFVKISSIGILALDDVLARNSESTHSMTLGDTLAEVNSSPSKALEQAETKLMLSRALEKLPERERTVLILYYFEGFNLAQIGDTLGVTESRACQIHAKAVLLLRKALGNLLQDISIY